MIHASVPAPVVAPLRHEERSLGQPDPPPSFGGLVVIPSDQLLAMIAEATARGVTAAVADMQRQAAAPTSPAKFLTAEQCAELIGVDLTTWRRLERRGLVPRGMRLGTKVVRWHPSVMDAFMRTGVVPQAPGESVEAAPSPSRPRKKSVFERQA